MAEWTGEKVDKSLINNGQQYVDGDGLRAKDVNAIVNNSLYASEKAEETYDKVDEYDRRIEALEKTTDGLYNYDNHIGISKDVIIEDNDLKVIGNIIINDGDENYNVLENLKKVSTALQIYPIGSIYMSVNSTSPASLFGGTWEQLKDRFLIGAGNSYAVNATGGETTHTLTIYEMPKHYHQNRLSGDTASSSDVGSTINSNSIWSTYGLAGDTSETGSSQPHNNMPPYLAVYMWKRTA